MNVLKEALQKNNKQREILIVDDSKTVRAYLEQWLTDAGYNTHQAVDGLDAWKQLQEIKIDVVICDHEMPEMSGLELCNRIKGDDNLRLIYFIMLTTHEQVADKVHGLSAGADDYVGKTTSSEEILARVKAGLRVKDLQDELKNAYGHLYEQERLASVGQLAAGVAHEINNPIGFVVSNLNSLQRYINTLGEFISDLNDNSNNVQGHPKKEEVDTIIEDAKELISESLDGAGRVAKIVAGMKSFARIDTGSDKPVDINASIETSLSLLAGSFGEKCKIITHYGELPAIHDVDNQLNQVLVNILSNAAQSIDEKGEICIRTWSKENSIFVEISDTGCGIPAEKLSRIFDPFYTTKAIGAGTGLGLSYCREVMEKNGGAIKVASTPGKGSTFTIQLPID